MALMAETRQINISKEIGPVDGIYTEIKQYCKILKISPGDYIFHRPFLRGLYWEGLIYGGKFVFQNPLGWPYSWREIYCFCFVLLCIWGQFPSTNDLEGRFNEGFFCITSLGGLYLEGLIHGRAYFRNFTVCFLQSIERDNKWLYLRTTQVHTLLSSSNSTLFYDFFHDLFKFSLNLGLTTFITFKNFKTLFV